MEDNQNTLDIIKMYRDTYKTMLITKLQQKTSKYTPFVTWMPGASGKRIEFNTRGNTEVDFRQTRFETKVPDEMEYGKRCMLPVGISKSMHYSDDDILLKGEFAMKAADFVEEMTYGFARKSDSLILGTVWDDVNKRWTIAQGNPSLDSRTSFYKGAAIGGILGPAYVGEHLNEVETIATTPVLLEGDAYDGSNLDYEQSTVVPVDYTDSGTPTVDTINIPKLMAAMQLMESRDALDDGGVLNVAIHPSMKYHLMTLPEFRDEKYGYQVLKDGFFNAFLNIRFLVSKQVPKITINHGGTSKEVYAVPVWRTEDIYAAWWENIKFDIVSPSMSYDEIVVSAKGAMGCARRRHNTVLTIHCAV